MCQRYILLENDFGINSMILYSILRYGFLYYHPYTLLWTPRFIDFQKKIPLSTIKTPRLLGIEKVSEFLKYSCLFDKVQPHYSYRVSSHRSCQTPLNKISDLHILQYLALHLSKILKQGSLVQEENFNERNNVRGPLF